ncbi:hypothetical protein GIB67_003406 [Kingdonia uniflora]|uniref:TFIIS N-terminal domain-containing protein n=1 Tax=Kingdonia uniflora TaxID=39325 RepID=A0A7J7P9Q2_9MAGN|nr:hypothetical protein GIB67_003406 [Kingdonia uniflora]
MEKCVMTDAISELEIVHCLTRRRALPDLTLVTFLRKGVELSPEVSSLVCRQVYDTASKHLWWLTVKDYTDGQQEELDQLLVKEQLKMHANSAAAQLKHGSNTVTSLSSQFNGKKRERRDWGSDPVNRECRLKVDDGDCSQPGSECMLKSEISLITDKGGLIDYDGVDKLVQIMKSDRCEKKTDLASRILLADVISATASFECLGQFLELNGLSVFDAWLKEVHKGETSDGSSTSKESDKIVEEFIFALLRALDKLPVNLPALLSCNVGKSVNHLRSHKNLEIQKKSRSLVDTWKKRVDAEMMNESKSGLSNAVSCPSKPGLSDVSHGGNKRAILSELPMKSYTKTTHVKSASGSVGSMKLSSSSPRSLPRAALREEKSSGSSQSQNNSQSCSSDLRKVVGSPWKEDARSSTSCASRHQRPSNRVLRKATTEKMSQSGLTHDGKSKMPPNSYENSHRLIVKLTNPGRSPARSVSEGSLDDPSALISGASFPTHAMDHDRRVKRKSDSSRPKVATDVNTESWQSNDVKDVLTGSDEGDGSLPGGARAACSSSDNGKGISSCEPKSGKSRETSLIESSVKCSDASATCVPSGDNVGMNLLSIIAATEMAKSVEVSPIGSLAKNSPVPVPVPDSCKDHNSESRFPSDKGVAYVIGYSNDADMDTKDGLLERTNGQQFHTSIMGSQQSIDPCSKYDGKHDEANELYARNTIRASNGDVNKDTGHTNEKIAESNIEISVNDGCNIDDVVPMKDEKEDDEHSPSYSNLGTEGSKIIHVHERREYMDKSMLNPSNSDHVWEPHIVDELKSQGAIDVEAVCHMEQIDIGKASQKFITPTFNGGVDSAEISAVSDYADVGAKDKLDKKEKIKHSSKSKSSCVEANGKEECTSDVEGSSFPVKLEFDLNDPLPMDEGSQDDLDALALSGCSSVVHMTSPLPAKGPFIPPENLMKGKGEHGWKGSAATSAFRPAEPRKTLDLPLSTAELTTFKQNRTPLNIDLNITEVDMEQNEMFGPSLGTVCNSSGLDVDLNMADEGTDLGQLSMNNNLCRLEVPVLPVKSSFGGYSKFEKSTSRKFDLNNGPIPNEVGCTQQVQHVHYSRDVESQFPWKYPFPIVSPILHDRAEQNYPIAATPNMQRNFNTDEYRGSILSSSPAMAFSPAAPFPYPGFPFNPSYPNSPASFSGGGFFPQQLVRPCVVSLTGVSTSGGAESSRMWGRQGIDLNPGPENGTDIEGERLGFPLGHRQLPHTNGLTEEQLRIYRHQASGEILKRKEL